MKIATEVKYGVLLGVVMCVYTVFMWGTNLDSTYLSIGHYFDIAVIILPLSITFLAIWAKSKETGPTLLTRIVCGLVVNLVGYIIYTPFLLLYHRYINPRWMDYVLKLKENELIAQNSSPDHIRETLLNIQVTSSDTNQIFSGLIVGVIVFGALFSLLTLPFFRKTSIENQ